MVPVDCSGDGGFGGDKSKQIIAGNGSATFTDPLNVTIRRPIYISGGRARVNVVNQRSILHRYLIIPLSR